jgi:putative phosphoribosyl transferase
MGRDQKCHLEIIMFEDRRHAGRQLAELLQKYKGMEGVVYGLPRGGVVVAEEISKLLGFSLDLILAHKIGHLFQPEYAIAAVSESGHTIAGSDELVRAEKGWFEQEKARQMQEIARKRTLYLKDRKQIPIKGKIAIIVDDGIATGLTMRVGIQELRDRHPKKLIAAVPVSPKSTGDLIAASVDEFVALLIPEDYKFFGSVGAYYRDFRQVEDEEVIQILNQRQA